jgi:alpha-tubulin suppressor-like RCC1 family protein
VKNGLADHRYDEMDDLLSVEDVVCGADFTLLRPNELQISGTLYPDLFPCVTGTITAAWVGTGSNAYGQLGNPGPSRTTPSAPGQIVNGCYQFFIPAGMLGIASGPLAQHCIGERGGTWIGWGRNDSGQLGDGTTTGGHQWRYVYGADQFTNPYSNAGTPSCGPDFTVAAVVVSTSGVLYAWGNSAGCRIPIPGGGLVLQPTLVGANHPLLPNTAGMASAGSGGGALTVSRFPRDHVVWGANEAGQLGIGSTDDVFGATRNSAFAPDEVAEVAWSGGGGHALVRKTDGTVWAFGRNDRGQLGQGTVDSNPHPTPVQVKSPDGSGFLENIDRVWCGGAFSLAEASDGTLYAWGANDRGQLGDGTTTDRSLPVVVGVESLIWELFAGEDFVVALYSDDFATVVGWGNKAGLGIGEATGNQLSPVQILQGGYALARAGGGARHCLVVTFDLDTFDLVDIKAWGDTRYGQCGVGQDNQPDGNNNNPSGLVLTPTTVLGENGTGTLDPNSVVQIACGGYQTVFVLSDGRVLACGKTRPDAGPSGSTGQPTFGTFVDYPIAVPQPFCTASEAVAGQDHVAVRRNDGTVWTYGWNSRGQLGLELVVDPPEPPQGDDGQFHQLAQVPGVRGAQQLVALANGVQLVGRALVGATQAGLLWCAAQLG